MFSLPATFSEFVTAAFCLLVVLTFLHSYLL